MSTPWKDSAVLPALDPGREGKGARIKFWIILEQSLPFGAQTILLKIAAKVIIFFKNTLFVIIF